MVPLEKKPFKGRIYYIDLRFYRNQDDLVKNIKKFGGKVEPFLCKEVTHIITDRYSSKTLSESTTSATSKSLISTPSPIQDSGYYGSPPVAISPTNDIQKPASALSRGQALLQKVKSKNEGSADLNTICGQWNIRMIHLHKVLNVINQYKNDQLAKKVNRENKANNKLSKNKKLKKFKEELTGPFIKFEDYKRTYKPVYKTFASMYECFHPVFARVFDKVRRKGLNNIDSVLKPSQRDNVSVQSSSKPNVIDNTKFISPLVVASRSMKKTLNHRKKKAKKRFCEICDCSYQNLNEHLQTLTHKEYQFNPENFVVVDIVSSSLPNVDEFLKKAGEDSKIIKDIAVDSSVNNSSSEYFINASYDNEISSEPYPYLKESENVAHQASAKDCLDKIIAETIFCTDTLDPATPNEVIFPDLKPSYCTASPLESNAIFDSNVKYPFSSYPFRNFGFGLSSSLISPDTGNAGETTTEIINDQNVTHNLGDFHFSDLSFALSPNGSLAVPNFGDANDNDDEFNVLQENINCLCQNLDDGPIDLSTSKKTDVF